MTDLCVSIAGLNTSADSNILTYQTIKKASTAAKSGTAVHVAPGAYEGGFTTRTDGVPYVLGSHNAYPGDTVYENGTNWN